ncbi:ComEC/Rec2 family competence protein [Corynebacterium tuscaniense]|uniref:ComEC/Rec2 family competence protein n=1 Tax=Corynebacterium tuscaniense TaxID=302449 RepID=UPI00123BC8EB|nr:ComEC/Rec2 family competence protein [Corynebacterium tuscaniense]KAA8737485.1 ComEC/Rec2 family competence protein [Corynebacterium tuscaniense]
MRELRLVPAALCAWGAAIAVIVAGPWAALIVVSVVILALFVWREPGQAILAGGIGACSLALSWWRVAVAQAFNPYAGITGKISGMPKEMDSGSWLVRVRVEGYPSSVPVFAGSLPEGAVPGAMVAATGQVTDSTRPGIGAFVLNGEVSLLSPPEGFAAFAAGVRERFATAVVEHVGPHAQGIIPGMVLGDVSFQSPEEQQAYVDTGLSHLSAVSGANCMYVATAALVVARLARGGLRVQLAAAGVALLVYAGLIGPEPSVLRATVSGLVGLVAVISSSRVEPIHALSLAIIGLILVDSDLAVNYAFALSVAATGSIVALSPLIYQALGRTGWPDIFVRVLSVAIAADMATVPLIAAMAGRVPVASVLANVAVSPVTGIVTVLGMAAAILAQISHVLAAPLLWVIAPLAGWVRTVAEVVSRNPHATVQVGPALVVVCYGWILAAFIVARGRMRRIE